MTGLPAEARPLLGHWELVSWSGRTESGEEVSHGGPAPAGDLIYLGAVEELKVIRADATGLFRLLELLDDGNADTPPADMRVPFVLAPAVVRVDPDSGASRPLGLVAEYGMALSPLHDKIFKLAEKEAATDVREFKYRNYANATPKGGEAH